MCHILLASMKLEGFLLLATHGCGSVSNSRDLCRTITIQILKKCSRKCSIEWILINRDRVSDKFSQLECTDSTEMLRSGWLESLRKVRKIFAVFFVLLSFTVRVCLNESPKCCKSSSWSWISKKARDRQVTNSRREFILTQWFWMKIWQNNYLFGRKPKHIYEFNSNAII